MMSPEFNGLKPYLAQLAEGATLSESEAEAADERAALMQWGA